MRFTEACTASTAKYEVGKKFKFALSTCLLAYFGDEELNYSLWSLVCGNYMHLI